MRTASLLVASIVVVVGIGVLLGRLATGPLSTWLSHDVDTPVRSFSVDHPNAAFARIARIVSTFGSSAVTGPIAVLVALASWLRTRNPRPAILLITTFTGAVVVTLIVKYTVHRSPASGPIPRFSAGTFPSGHALFAIVVYGTLALLLVRATGLWPLRTLLVAMLVALPIAIGLARVYLLEHYLSDVVGSVVLGVALVAAAVLVIGTHSRPDAGD